MDRIRHVNKMYKKGGEIPKFNIGDTVLVHVKIKEEEKTRIQVFEGVVIKKKSAGAGQTFTVRRVSYGEGLERTFPMLSPSIAKVEVKKKGAVRRAKLFYLKKKKGKESKVAEKIEEARSEKEEVGKPEEVNSSPDTEDAAPRAEGQ
ncbi:MAG: 50S ribosomal protein L19 [Candidatus Omnitrophota bacterium]